MHGRKIISNPHEYLFNMTFDIERFVTLEESGRPLKIGEHDKVCGAEIRRSHANRNALAESGPFQRTDQKGENGSFVVLFLLSRRGVFFFRSDLTT